jgi:hypothetical protein
MCIDYIIITYTQTAKRWLVTLGLTNGEEFHSNIHAGSWEDYVKLNFPNIPVKLYDWKTKMWTTGTQDLA